MTKIQQVGKELFKLTFSSPKKELLIQPGERIHLTNYKIEAPSTASQITMLLRKKLKGKKLLDIYQHDNDRVIVLEFQDYFLILEFFSHGNFVLTDKDYSILFTFRKEAWKDRELKKGAKYKFPANLKSIQLKEDYTPVTKEDYERQGSMNKALDEFYSNLKEENKKLKKLKTRLEKQQQTLEEYKQKAELYNKIGNWIYEKYSLIEKLFKADKKELEKLGVKRKGRKLVLKVNLKQGE